ncbi:hypothetical protein [Parabacteroides pacaensis]|uniref:hypothetical protein n=1 Tax=Parabacteroides pacaensis TaxID=2086575 RepID=UPI000D0FC7EA|nr:hypothetical protein [Parabacteroides pacaensis]
MKTKKSVSFFSSVYSKVPQTVPFEEVLQWIQSGKFRQIQEIRSLYNAGKVAEADAMKRKLPAFTPSGIF